MNSHQDDSMPATSTSADGNADEPRRTFLSRGGALLASALLPGCGAAGEGAQAAATDPTANRGGSNSRRPYLKVPPNSQPGPAGALPTTVVLSVDAGLTPNTAELVTFGLPLSPGLVNSVAQIRVMHAGRPLAISCAPGLRWHWKDGSLRSVSIQCVLDMTKGPVTVAIDANGRDTSTDLARRPVEQGWTDSGFRDPDGRTLLKPRVLPLHDPDYLAASGIVAPFVPPQQDDDANTGIWLTVKGALDGAFPWGRNASGQIDYDSWLFDRPGTLFKLSMQFRDAEKRRALLRNAAISKRHYFAYVRRCNIEESYFADYWWDLKRYAVIGPNSTNGTYGTTMYQQCQAAKLAWALLGDDTQWTGELLLRWASDIRTKAAGTAGADVAAKGAYSYPGKGWTERLAAIPSLFHLHAWEITGDATLRASLDQRIAYLKDMQQTHKPHEIENGWPASTGVFRHSISKHDLNEAPTYVCNFLQSYPAGTQVAKVSSVLSDADIQKWVIGKKTFNIAGVGAVGISSALKNSDGTWTFTFSKPLTSAVVPGGNFHIGGDMSAPPYVEADQGFSPWMSVFIADYLWQQYALLGSPEIPEMLRRLGNAINERGFVTVVAEDGTSFKQDIPAPGWMVGAYAANRAGPDAYPLYMATDLAPRGVCYLAEFTQTHTEMLFPIALALRFENDPVRRMRLATRAKRLEFGLYHSAANFAPQGSPNPLRMVNWQHSASPLRTWKLIQRDHKIV